MKDSLVRCLDLIGMTEAGYTNNPRDPGGPTNHGITQRTLAAWRGHPVTVVDVQKLTHGEARDIIIAQYAAPIRFDTLPAGLDYALLDCSVNSGSNRAVRLLQEVLGFEGGDVDGVLGVHTKAKLDGVNDLAGLVLSYCAARLDFMQKLRTWSTFGNGWASRVNRVQAEALAMAGGTATITLVRTLITNPDEQAKAVGSTKLLSLASGRAALATLVSVAGTAGVVASQASGLLAPYGDVAVVRYVLLVLACVSAASSLVVALDRARAGALT